MFNRFLINGQLVYFQSFANINNGTMNVLAYMSFYTHASVSIKWISRIGIARLKDTCILHYDKQCQLPSMGLYQFMLLLSYTSGPGSSHPCQCNIWSNFDRSPRASVLLPSLTKDSSTSVSQKALQSHSPAKLLGYLFQRQGKMTSQLADQLCRTVDSTFRKVLSDPSEASTERMKTNNRKLTKPR